MEEGYVDSLKQAILDYILLDTNEQARLGVTLPEQVRKTNSFGTQFTRL